MAPLLDRPSPRTNLTDHDRSRVLSAFLSHATGGKLKQGSLKAVSASFGVSTQTAQRIWRRANENFKSTGVFSSPSRKRKSGRRKINRDRELARLRSVAPQRRSTLRAAATACDLSLSTLFRELKVGSIRIGTSVVKPMLTDANMERRLKLCAGHVDQSSMLFNAMEDVIHVDEKLFYMTTVKRRYVLLPDEAVPTRRVRSKRHIPKVMVLAAVASPHTDPRTGAFFDGKIGLWAFLTHEPAQRSSRNRPAGTLVPKELPVNKSTYREMLVERVLPAIRTK
ncbi:hypothetical protein PF005_g31558 [Phytophthora fragariae]|nr:hypothetical protein PF005_g31558 [Phytophthora fragariae]